MRSLIWHAAVAAAMGVGILWLCGFPIGAEGGLFGGPEGPQAWFQPGSADPVVTASVEVALR